tara:strand:+ start:166 stop:738 length:573 start_codon:yes stop_codon:yes gene_type:complete
MQVIKTDNSYLHIAQYPNKELIDQSVIDIMNKLDENPPIKLFGKICHQRRSVGFFSDDSIGYRYSNQISRSKSMTPALSKLLEHVNSIYDTRYNGILVNKYNTGEDYISAHSDNEVNLDDSGVVAISYGATRKFRIRNKETKKIVGDFPMRSYSILQMGGQFQKEFTHEIPIEKKIKETRISFTFRKHTE